MWPDSGFFFDHLPHTPYVSAIHNCMCYFCTSYICSLICTFSNDVSLWLPLTVASVAISSRLSFREALLYVGTHSTPSSHHQVHPVWGRWCSSGPTYSLCVSQHILFWTHSLSKYLLSVWWNDSVEPLTRSYPGSSWPESSIVVNKWYMLVEWIK